MLEKTFKVSKTEITFEVRDDKKLYCDFDEVGVEIDKINLYQYANDIAAEIDIWENYEIKDLSKVVTKLFRIMENIIAEFKKEC